MTQLVNVHQVGLVTTAVSEHVVDAFVEIASLDSANVR